MLQLLNNWNISYTFNVADLFAYHPDDEELYEPNSRMSSFQRRGTYVGWLYITSEIHSGEHNLGHVSVFSV